MRILHTVESYTPTLSGMQEVVKQISERLVQKGHVVYVATKQVNARSEKVINGVNVIEFNVDGNFVRGLSGEIESYEKFLLESNFDIVTNFAAQQWATDIALPILDLIKGKKVFVPTGFSGFYEDAYAPYFHLMKDWMKSYDMNVFLSDNYRDVNFAKEHKIDKRTLIPNGADETQFLSKPKLDIRSELSIKKDEFLILTVGLHTGMKGHKEAIEMFDKANIENATLLINGNSLFGGCSLYCNSKKDEFNSNPKNKQKRKRIIIKESSREFTVDAFKQSDLFLFPSNLECSPIVLFEAAASKLPFLVTDVGNSAEIIEWLKGGLLLPTNKLGISGNVTADINGSAVMIEQLFNDEEVRKSLSLNGFKNWKEKYTWKQIADNFEKLYLKLHKEQALEDKNYPTIDLIMLQSNEEASNTPNSNCFNTIFTSNKNEVSKNTKYYSDLNEAINQSQAEWIVFYDKNLFQDPNYIIKILNKIMHSEANLIYPNFSTIADNKNRSDKLSLYESDLNFKDLGFNELFKSNKLFSTFNGIAFKASYLKANPLDYNQLEWDTILELSKTNGLDYIFVHKNLNDFAVYKEIRIDNNNDHLKKEVHFFNKWVNKVFKDNSLTFVRNYLAWRSNLDMPNITTMNYIIDNIDNQARKILFKISLGSFKLFLIIYEIANYARFLMYSTKNLFNGIIYMIKKTIIILKT